MRWQQTKNLEWNYFNASALKAAVIIAFNYGADAYEPL